MREKFTCRFCKKITQPPAPFHAIARALAGASLFAMLAECVPESQDRDSQKRIGLTGPSRPREAGARDALSNVRRPRKSSSGPDIGQISRGDNHLAAPRLPRIGSGAGSALPTRLDNRRGGSHQNSLLEGDGFEPSVPQQIRSDLGTAGPSPITVDSLATRNWKFESISLQRRILSEPHSARGTLRSYLAPHSLAHYEVGRVARMKGGTCRRPRGLKCERAIFHIGS